MKKLKDEELVKINGGFSGWVVAGIIDGIARPKKCNG